MRRLVIGSMGAVLMAPVFMSSAAASAPDAHQTAAQYLPSSSNYVINGTPAAGGAFPFFTVLLIQVPGSSGYLPYCDASLIAHQWVLTAAHCVTGNAPAHPDAVLIGRQSAGDTNGDWNHADGVVVAPGWNPTTLENDVALIHLAHPSPQPTLALIRPDQAALWAPGVIASLIGMGDVDPNVSPSPSPTLQQAPQPILSDAFCQGFYGTGIGFSAASMLCAGQSGIGPCFGDSGGPLMVVDPLTNSPVEIGVVSHGGVGPCASTPPVYARVAAEVSWIAQTTASGPPTPTPAPVPTPTPVPFPVPGPVPVLPPATPVSQAIWLLGRDGGVFAFGSAGFHGSTGNMTLNKPVVGIAARPDRSGYWFVASDGGIFGFDAPFLGSMGGSPLNQPIVGMAPAADGAGYWLVASDGGIFSFGSAKFYGSTGGIHLNQPIVAMVPTPSGHGYWFVAADGGVFNYGDAAFLGSGAGVSTSAVVGMAATPDGKGYWLATADGGVEAFGDAPFLGAGAHKFAAPVVGIAATSDGRGYRLAAADGEVAAFGDATALGMVTGHLNGPIVGLA